MNLENTKVYTTDMNVIRKYGELCGVTPYYDQDRYPEFAGYRNDPEEQEVLASFLSGSLTDRNAGVKTLTAEEINAMHQEKFGQIESPEEREALDMIDTTSNQVESLANDSESPIWENGTACFHDSIYGFAAFLPEGLFFKPKDMNKLFSVKLSELSKAEPESKKYDRAVGDPVKLSSPEWSGEGFPPVGVECCFTPDNNLWGFASTDTYLGEVLKYEGEQFIFLLSHDKYNMRPCHLIVSRTDKGEFSKPESPEQQAERERLEAAYDLYLARHVTMPAPYHYDEFIKADGTLSGFLAIVDKTGYRKAAHLKKGE